MTKRTEKPVKPVTKPFLTGNITDERTPKSALVFFGCLLIAAFMGFLVSATISGGPSWLRIIVNVAIILLILFVFYTNGANRGTEAVSRGEILWQKREKGQEVSDSDRRLCYHGLKGFFVGFLGTIPLLVPAILLACLTQVQTTDSGTLPSWIQGYLGREEIGGALVHYTQPLGMTFLDYLRLFVRIFLMPYINIPGAANHTAVLWVERLGPLLSLLPAFVYGLGYRTGKSNRTRVHTAISESNRIRIRREKKARKARREENARRKGPEQLN